MSLWKAVDMGERASILRTRLPTFIAGETMRSIWTVVFSTLFFGMTTSDGWCPEPANLGAPIGSRTGATAADVQPGRLKKMDLGRASSPSGLKMKSYTSSSAVGAGKTASSAAGKVYQIKPVQAPQTNPRPSK